MTCTSPSSLPITWLTLVCTTNWVVGWHDILNIYIRNHTRTHARTPAPIIFYLWCLGTREFKRPREAIKVVDEEGEEIEVEVASCSWFLGVTWRNDVKPNEGGELDIKGTAH